MAAAHSLANLGVVLVSATLGVWRCRNLFQTHPTLKPNVVLKAAPHLYLLLPLPIVLIPLSQFLESNPDWQWNMPFWLQLHFKAAAWGIILGVVVYVFAFSTSAYFLARHAWKGCVLAVAICVLIAFEILASSSFQSQPPKLRQPRVSGDGVILQSSTSTCAAAAAANIANHLGVVKTERDFVGLFGTTDEGTLASQIAAGLRKAGFAVTKQTVRDSSIDAVTAPAMLFIAQDTHAVAFIRMTNGLAEIWDPLAGKKLLKKSFLQESWSGHALEIQIPKGKDLH